MLNVRLLGHLHSPSTKTRGLKHSHCLDDVLKNWPDPHEIHALPSKFKFCLMQLHVREVVFHTATDDGQNTQVDPLGKKSALHLHL